MALTPEDCLGYADPWHFLQHPEKDFWELARLARSISLDVDDCDALSRDVCNLCAFIEKHVSNIVGTLIEVRASDTLSDSGTGDIPFIEDTVPADVTGRLVVNNICVLPELILTEEEYYFGRQGDLFLETVPADFEAGSEDAVRFWIPSQKIDRLQFLAVAYVQVN